jgi:uncharacterized phosphosugar-binding protein
MSSSPRSGKEKPVVASDYLAALSAKLDQLRQSQSDNIARAAALVADSLAAGGLLYTFGCGHSAALAQEIYYRAGGLLLVEAIFGEDLLLHRRPVGVTTACERLPGYATLLLEGSGARKGDVILVISTSGRNITPVEMALAARQRGLPVIALTSGRYARALPSRHPSGKCLPDVADVVLDNQADPGDASLELPGLAEKVGPVSTALGAALLQALVVQVIANLLERGLEPPVFLSSNLAGGDEHNRRLIARHRDRLRFL